MFQPVVSIGGYAGWRVLQTTGERQREAFDESSTIQRQVDYYREHIGDVKTAEDLVNDRRLLTVALGAYGLSEEINKKAFVQKVLEEGTESSTAFANRLGDQRYRDLANAFDFGNVGNGTNLLLDSFQDEVVEKFKRLEFERAIGNADPDMRIAMNFERYIGEIAGGPSADRIGWYSIMGNRPLRELVATAFGLPSSVATLDIDKQREIFEEKADQILGSSSPTVFLDGDKVEQTIQRFFLFRQIEGGSSVSNTAGSTALTLLQSGPFGGGGAANLLLSNI